MVTNLKKYFPYDHHILVYNSARTYLKCAPDAPPARWMVLNVPKPGKNWLIEITELDSQGRQVYAPGGEKLKKKVQMTPGTLPNGESRSLYFPEGHPRAGVFKEMPTILRELGFIKEVQLKRECPGFRCLPDRVNCCIH
jgi:hypothetical protein